MIKELISPYQPFAFCDVVLHKVVQNSLQYELPDDLWDAFNEAFTIYWDEEAGLGGLVGQDYMFLSIKQQLNNQSILIPDNILYSIVETIWDFIDQIPGVIIHD